MTGHEMQSIRDGLGLSRRKFAVALGYEGSAKTNQQQVWRLETGQREISPDVEARLVALRDGKVWW